MPLRCLLFSSHEELVQPIWQVLADLGIEGEYCGSAVDAVEKVTTQPFQIVITDWDDQPEAAFLLKTARDQKAAHRPLTLAIVSDEARLPEALRAGANSVLMKPIRPEQVRETMSTACELLRAKQSAPPPRPVEAGDQLAVKEMAAMAAAAAGDASVSVPTSVPKKSEKTFRAGEFLQSPSSALGAQFVTECEVQKSMDQAAASDVDALTELEPAAPRKALEGWASLQARLTNPSAPAAGEHSSSDPPARSESPGFGKTPSFGSQPEPSTEEIKSPKKDAPADAESEAALFSYMSGEAKEESHPASEARPKRSKTILVSALAVVCVALAAPRTRHSLVTIYRNTAHAARNWLNPQPAPVPQVVAQHETFGQEGDEYKFPVAENIPDATTDPSQIRVLPVLDPTAKPAKGAEAGSSAQAITGENASTPQSPSGSVQSEQAQVLDSQVKDPTESTAGSVPPASPDGASAPVQAQANPPVPQDVAEPALHPTSTPPQSSAPQHIVPPHIVQAGTNAPIPSSLRSQVASMTPEASGAKPVEAAMSSIEPVTLPESAALGLLAQPVDPEYPATAKASGQRGSVVLQVLIGRDGAVQDAKFLQGSLVFARSAIDAVKQWRFKPYLMNGRPVSVQSVITLNFKPPA
jgi:protein TonB